MVVLLNRISVFFIVFAIVLNYCCIFVGAAPIVVSAESAILMNADTGEVIYEKNCHQQRGMASTTKIMTSIIAIESCNLSDEVTVKGDDVKVEGTSIGLKEDDVVTFDVLVKGMLLESGNDAANVTATAISGSYEAFSILMNEKAKVIGMKNTSFKNPSGLTEDGHFSTAYDMALLACYAIENPVFKSICSQKSIRVFYGNPAYERTFLNHNRLLDSCDGVFGIKTGFTKASGRCLVSAVQRNGVSLVAVTLNAPDDWNDHQKLFDYGFEKTVERKADFDDSNLKIEVVGSDKKSLKIGLLNELKYCSVTDFKTETIVFCEKFLYAGVKTGDIVGKVEIRDNKDTLLCYSYLVAKESADINFEISKEPPTLLDKLKNFRKIN